MLTTSVIWVLRGRIGRQIKIFEESNASFDTEDGVSMFVRNFRSCFPYRTRQDSEYGDLNVTRGF